MKQEPTMQFVQQVRNLADKLLANNPDDKDLLLMIEVTVGKMLEQEIKFVMEENEADYDEWETFVDKQLREQEEG